MLCARRCSKRFIRISSVYPPVVWRCALSPLILVFQIRKLRHRQVGNSAKVSEEEIPGFEPRPSGGRQSFRDVPHYAVPARGQMQAARGAELVQSCMPSGCPHVVMK